MDHEFIGSADVYRDANGNLQVDQSSISGDYDDDYDDDEDDAEFGFRRRRNRGQRRQGRRRRQDFNRGERRQRQDERAAGGRRGNRAETPSRDNVVSPAGAGAGWGKTLVSGSVTTVAASADSIVIRLQHDFKAKDLTFEGSAANALVTSITFGDENVFSNVTGVPASIFAVGGQMRDYVQGREMRGGLDITVGVITAGAGDKVVATFTGEKPVINRCG